MSRWAIAFTTACTTLMFVVAPYDAEAGRHRRCRQACESVCCQPVCCQPVCCQPTGVNCSANVDVYFNGSTICIRGKVGCNGKECRFDTCLGNGDVTIDCGDMQVKLKPRGRQVCIEARVKILGAWSRWVDLGCYP